MVRNRHQTINRRPAMESSLRRRLPNARSVKVAKAGRNNRFDCEILVWTMNAVICLYGGRVMPIPEFADRFHLPPGEHLCDIDEVETRFGCSNDCRRMLWRGFRACLDFMREIGLEPRVILIDGSFVTGRDEPGDVDAVALIPYETIRKAMSNANEEMKQAIHVFASAGIGSIICQRAIKNSFGAHVLLAVDDSQLGAWSSFFRVGGSDGLRPPDPNRDPEWVEPPGEEGKGILRVNMGG